MPCGLLAFTTNFRNYEFILKNLRVKMFMFMVKQELSYHLTQTGKNLYYDECGWHLNTGNKQEPLLSRKIHKHIINAYFT